MQFTSESFFGEPEALAPGVSAARKNPGRVSPPEARVENVRDAIGAALKRHAEREAEGIDVSLKEGTASLAGKVHTWAEKQAILGALKYAPGVERVNDQLSIDPYF